MPMWPFGRKGRRASKPREEGPTPAAEGKKPAVRYPDQRGSAPVLTATATAPPGRRHSSSRRRKRRTASTSPSNAHRPPLLPPQPADLHHKPPPVGSVEDITALPSSQNLGISPHLRPVLRERADIPYNFSLNTSHSHSSLPPQPSSSLPRRKSTKRRKNDHVREEEIRAMSTPLPTNKRPVTYTGGGLLRRESKKVRGSLTRHLDRPNSNLSLSLEDSIRSSMSGSSETRAFRVNALDVFSPRPTIRCSVSSQLGPVGSQHNTPSRVDSRKEKRATYDKSAMRGHLIDDLADDLDSAALRDIMERDKRRRERKRKADEERLRKKLERRAAKQQQQQLLQKQKDGEGVDADAAAAAAAAAVGDRSTDPETVGLGIEKASTTPKRDAARSPKEPSSRSNMGTYFEYPSSEGEEPHSKSHSTTTATDNQETAAAAAAIARLSPPSDSQPTETPLETPVVGTAQAVRYSHASLSPPTSPVHGHTRGQSNVSQMPDLLSETVAAVAATSGHNSLDRRSSQSWRRRSSEASSRRFAVWRSWFSRSAASSKRGSVDQGKATPSEVSFSNTSRESMARQGPPMHLQQPQLSVVPPAPQSLPQPQFPLVSQQQQQQQQQQQINRAAGVPSRTRSSRFREDLPEYPASPPESRVQSPETTTQPIAIPARRGQKQPQNIRLDTEASLPRSSLDDSSARKQTDSPSNSTGGTREPGLMSQSLASVDSEGSWLSGKPIKRRSQQNQLRGSVGSSSLQRHHGDSSASYEELGIADDEYFRRISPPPNDSRRSTLSGDLYARKSSRASPAPGPSSDTEEDPRGGSIARQSSHEESEMVVRGDVSRQPTVVHHQPHKSTEGLLNFFDSSSRGRPATPPAQIAPDSPIDENASPMPSPGAATVQRARSVDLGKGHVRQISAGSARLLDIPSRRQSTGSRISSQLSQQG